ncbi:hemagglutinin/amebocyte aggregation factor [Limulus polyphemus]|uniref:Hemagglutinin/amebocyte aggregation factor n=1 Tax=Limulus polyphemus TaxID=6850 RepID=HAAF_LIMPO|nr:hemagglutinin/amebocyte aggregation factor [Limulus polyphemus]Q01528.1 RecName: Full=Hemagglutinin/amebocyte aggregation factor; AltName: Full=18K-LAF; Flags: Precursor [Limulus polyphemus]AAA28272.1 hemagglutinin and aggregation factor [Limulus polyphemus]
MNSPAIVIIIFSTLTFSEAWVNDWDGALNFQCQLKDSIKTISSIHSNHHEDRRWNFGCERTLRDPSCYFTNYVNDWDKLLHFTCKSGEAIAGFNSYHDNRREDRRWKIYCCKDKNKCTDYRTCAWTGYVNSWDGDLHYTVPKDYVLTGVISEHDNHREDRRWKFQHCRLKNC